MEVTPRLHSQFILAVFTGMVAVFQSDRRPFSQRKGGRFPAGTLAVFVRNTHLISDVPKKEWKLLAYEAVNNSSGGELAKKKCKEAIVKLYRHALFIRNTTPGKLPGWLETAQAYHHDRPFQAIVTDQYKGAENYVVQNDLDLTEHPNWQTPQAIIVEREACKMVSCIRPMLDCANEVILVDRYFDADQERFVNVLISIMKALKQRPHGPTIRKVTYHIGDKRVANEVERLCIKKVRPKIPAGMCLEIVCWHHDELHDRFILTDIGGILLGQGLDEKLGQAGPSKVQISRLSLEVYKEWWSACSQKKMNFRVESEEMK